MSFICKYSLREKCPNTELFPDRIQSEYRKIRTRNNYVLGNFHAVTFSICMKQISNQKKSKFKVLAFYHNFKVSQIRKSEASNAFTILYIYHCEDLILQSITQSHAEGNVVMMLRCR